MLSDDEIENEGAGHMTGGEVVWNFDVPFLTDQGVPWSQVADPPPREMIT